AALEARRSETAAQVDRFRAERAELARQQAARDGARRAADQQRDQLATPARRLAADERRAEADRAAPPPRAARPPRDASSGRAILLHPPDPRWDAPLASGAGPRTGRVADPGDDADGVSTGAPLLLDRVATTGVPGEVARALL